MVSEKKSVPMREQAPQERKKNFIEVPLGYSEQEAIQEANRCLQCKHEPCVGGCPVNIHIPAFIKSLREGRFQEAIDIIHQTDSLPCVTGRVCPQEEQCQLPCVMGKIGEPIMIGRLERFVADWELGKGKVKKKKSVGKKVAVVGSGPAGLACAAELAAAGVAVTVFEGFHELGGVLIYGIPEFRLPKAIVATEINRLKQMGVEFKTNMLIGRVLTISELQETYAAVFIGTGAGLPNFMGIPGENLNGIYSANEYLTRVNLMRAYKFPEYDTPVKIGKKVAVIGGGNVAMDAARTALRLGADEVHLVYRRTAEEMPARAEEVHHAQEEGIIFDMLAAPLRYDGINGFVSQMTCQRMSLGEPDASGRRRPEPISGSEYTQEIDQVIVAIGTTPNPIIQRTTEGLEFTKHGQIKTDDNGLTSLPGVFAGGDIVTGAATVVTAMGAGRKAAASINNFLKI
jgi:glutamate synthase (NADPH/NADH) small chain